MTGYVSDEQNAELVRQSSLFEKLFNKAGYTAKTSRGRVGRGENTRFHSLCGRFQLKRDNSSVSDRRTDEQSLL